MSRTYDLPSVNPFQASNLLDRLGHDDVVTRPEVKPSVSWPAGVVRLHRYGLSARSVEVEYNESGYNVRLLTASNNVDMT